MFRPLIAVASLSLALMVVGCSGGAPEKTVGKVEFNPTGNAPVEGQLKVALLTPGPVNDSGWNAMAYDGLKAIETELGAKISNQEATDAAIKDAMRSYAQDGYNLVIGHGFEYNDPEIEVAADFPKTVFVSSSGGKTATNAGAFRFYLEQGFYLCGLLAGSMTKTNTVGMVGGPDVPSIRSTFMAFEAGAKAANPGVKVIQKFTGKDSDVAAAKQLTLQEISEGADFLIHQTNAAAPGFFQACEEKKVYSFGANLNQNDASPSVIASAVIVAKPAFLALAKEVKEGTYKGHIQLMGMKDGAIDFILNPKHQEEIPVKVHDLLTATSLKIVNGTFEVPKDDF